MSDRDTASAPPAALPPIPDGTERDRYGFAVGDRVVGRYPANGAGTVEKIHAFYSWPLIRYDDGRAFVVDPALLASPSVVADAGAGDADIQLRLRAAIALANTPATGETGLQGIANALATVPEQLARLTSERDAATRELNDIDRSLESAGVPDSLPPDEDENESPIDYAGRVEWLAADRDAATRRAEELASLLQRACDTIDTTLDAHYFVVEMRAALAPSRAVPTEDRTGHPHSGDSNG